MVTPRGELSWRPLAETHVFQDRGDLGDSGVLPVLGELSLQGRFQHSRAEGKALDLFPKKGKKETLFYVKE